MHSTTMKPKDYDVKFRKFLRRIADARANGVTLFVITRPEELGDTYEEVMESLNQLAAADMNLAVMPRDERIET